MAEPTEQEMIAAIEEMTSLRGWIINSFSQIECKLADLINQCEQFADYEELSRQQLPMGAGKRVARVREMMKAGPLAAHAEALEAVLARFMEFEELRHLMTHGFAALHITPHGDMGMTFMRYVPPLKGAKFTEEQAFYRLRTMREQKASSVEFATGAMAELRRIYQAIGIDPDLLGSLNKAPERP